MKTTFPRAAQSAMTLVELLVVIVLVATVIGLLLIDQPGSHVYSHGNQAKALSNARQIVLALRLYAEDHNGKFPSFTLDGDKPTTTPVTTSNDALCQLFPNYINQESIFWLAKSAWCTPNPPPETYDNPVQSPSKLTLASGQNEWAYVLQLGGASNPNLPLLADGFANPVSHTYTSDPSQKGGVWKGRRAVVIHVDGSGVIPTLSPDTIGAAPAYAVAGPCGAATYGDIFTTANAANGWLAPENVVVNPK